jgi:endonuclease YncB( thermonuclease family)
MLIVGDLEQNMLKQLALLGLLSGPAMAANVQIVDGDTLDIDGKRYRINGIDAPEAGQKCTSERGKDWSCGDVATNTLYNLTHGKSVSCKTLAIDSYGRDVARCTADGTDLAGAMVERGMAWAFLKFSDEYEAAQETAKAAKIGIWRGPSQPAWEYRATSWNKAAQTAPKGCPIKGNITKNGKIYHPPWSPWYSRTRIDTTKGERWFCDEAQAIKAGWRAPNSK